MMKFYKLCLTILIYCDVNYSWALYFKTGSNHAFKTDYSLPDSSGFVIELDNKWTSEVDHLDEVGFISVIRSMDNVGSHLFLLHRGDREWNSSTFDENYVYTSNRSNPIESGVIANMVQGVIKNQLYPKRFFMPHGMFVDHEENVWITDVALHQVYKLSKNPNQDPLMVLGKAFVPGTGLDRFCQPTDVVVAKNGEFFVSDGYCNNRILKFNRNGVVIKTWGQKTQDPTKLKNYDLNVPHQLALFEETDLLCVADRENGRVVCYTAGLNEDPDMVGNYLFQFNMRHSAPVYGLAIEPVEKLLFIAVDNDKYDNPSYIKIIDLKTLTELEPLTVDSEYGFRDLHSITTCPSYDDKTCLLISTRKYAQKYDPTPRAWLYKIHLVTEQTDELYNDDDDNDNENRDLLK